MTRLTAVGIAAGVLGLSGWALMTRGIYGWTLFASIPFVLGGLGGALSKAGGYRGAAKRGALANCLAAACLLVFAFEGLICIGMALPLAALCGAAGGVVAHRLLNVQVSRGATAAVMLPLGFATLGYDFTARPPTFAVTTSVEVAAPAQTVWRNVISFGDLPQPEEWYFRTGLAYPLRARLEGTGAGAVRYCEFSTGPFVEPIDVWEEPRRLSFRVTSNPQPMREWSPYGALTATHLDGYMISKRGEFRLIPLDGNRTRLVGTTWYQHGLWPTEYWRLWSDAIIHRIHLRVLRHIKKLSES
ncbi:MAG: SRPBCC family protein [Bryobacterales bacterium]|nr:SRPBCC family protein [Bryobacterales bacterium]